MYETLHPYRYFIDIGLAPVAIFFAHKSYKIFMSIMKDLE